MKQPRAPRPAAERAPEGLATAARNEGGPLLLDWALDVELGVDRPERRLASPPSGAIPDDTSAEIALLLRAVGVIDLTSLSGDDTPARVRELCGRARQPLPQDLCAVIGEPAEGIRTAAVCVYHHFLEVALRTLEGSGIPVAVVSAGFPAGLSPLRQRIDEVRASVAGGADEIDAVINRSLVLTGEWEALYDEVRAFRDASGSSRLKVILATGELGTLTNVARTARLCMLAGADFIKTSTGKEAVNATYPVGRVMLRAIDDYRALTGQSVGFKAAGGIRSPRQALEWMRLVEETLGSERAGPDWFRIGASGLLGAIVSRLQECAAGEAGPHPTAPGMDAEGDGAAY